MLIPKFTLSQNDEFVFVKVHCPYTSVGDAEACAEGTEFVFSSPPYHLRLELPGEVVEGDRTSAKYDCDSGNYSFALEKVHRGEHFANLDTVTNLLAPTVIPDLNPDLVQIIGETDDNTILPTTQVSYANANFRYGFANRLSSDGFRGAEYPNIFELKSPEEMSHEDRHKFMRDIESEKFSSDHYLADFFDPELIAPFIQYKPPWDVSQNVDFTDDELTTLKDLPNKEYLLTDDEFNKVTYNLVDVLYAYCYEKRVTLSENNIESSWTINRISGTLSWFVVFFSMRDALISCYRRSLVYPIYRHFDLSAKVHEDVAKLFRLGRKCVVKSLVEIYKLFNQSQDARYILNQLYIKDFLIFSQKCSDETYKNIGDELDDVLIDKASLKLDLEEYEEAGKLVQMEESHILENTMAMQMSSLNISSGDEKIKYPPPDVIRTGDSYSDDSEDSSDDSSSSDSSSSSELDSDDDSSE